ncbi:potassium channel family protein [Pseudomonas sp. DNDY-54]|uniref:potassium channel family protein n=1 Tax=Pseudomonas sp. DNDY-54 TaxID=2870860 RepID=UPI001CA43530|nr:potassium channel family protein [Pseudomonas sp. DNDY-54]
MIFSAFKNIISQLANLTPNSFLPKLGEKLTTGRVKAHDWAEVYLLLRFIFALALTTFLPKSSALLFVIFIIQFCSIIYLLKIVFPVDGRNLKDPSRSLFFAFGHYIEIGLSMGYVYWCLDSFNQNSITISKSVYFSFITMTTIGFGDITPNTDIARLIVTAHSIVGLFMLVTVIGIFLSLSTSDPKRQE